MGKLRLQEVDGVCGSGSNSQQVVQILVTALSSRSCRVHLDSVFNKALFLVQFTSATVFWMCCLLQHNTTQHGTAQHNTIQHNTIQHSNITQHHRMTWFFHSPALRPLPLDRESLTTQSQGMWDLDLSVTMWSVPGETFVRWIHWSFNF